MPDRDHKCDDATTCSELEEVKEMIATAKKWGVKILVALIGLMGSLGVYALGRLDNQDKKIGENIKRNAVLTEGYQSIKTKQTEMHQDIREIRKHVLKP